MQGKVSEIAGGVTAPKGFLASAAVCGIKNPNDKKKKDLAFICSEVPAAAAAVFTTSKVKAAPVKVSHSHMRSNDIRAIIANSGNANACTGPSGIRDARAMTLAAASELELRPTQVLVCSTGIIGVPMPIDRILPKISQLVADRNSRGGAAAAEAIMTSDTRPKSLAIKVKLGKAEVKIGGMAKGAGMICPGMATMLCFITTDAKIEKGELQRATLEAVEKSFNRISVDGDMSTNDAVIVLANGAAGNRVIESGTKRAQKFRDALSEVMLKLALMIVKDGERVTKLVQVNVLGARTFVDARKVADAVSNSLLVKCSWNGSDPNWGRIMHAIGYSKASVKEDMIDIYFNGKCACEHGMKADTPIKELQKVVAKDNFCITINLNLGEAEHTIYTSDISPEYVDFNRSEYAVKA